LFSSKSRPIAIFYEHPDWFRPLFAELDRRAIPYVRLDARCHRYDPQTRAEDYALFFNRMSPSAYLRGAGHAIFYTLGLLEQLERSGVRVINGAEAFRYEISKARQLQLLASLGLDAPRAHVINCADQALEAARELRFPVVVKANIGGSGAGIARYDTPDQLARAVENERLDLGIDGTALVQEFIPARNGHITRVETLGGRYLYAINVYSSADNFNLCPADACQTTDGVELARSACPVDAPKSGLRVEAYTPPAEVIAAVERIAQAAHLDVGGIEYIVDDRDGRLYYYDINALSNFVADAPRVVGFDPFAKLVDFLVAEAR
jgi:glutathione synthase/RimK-type ligase-like ATP-grasp enzyme